MDRNSQLQNLGEQLERMHLFNAGASLTGTNYQIRALEESNAALTSRLMLVEGTVKTQERLLRDVINHLRNAGGDNTIMQDNEHTLKMRALQGEVTMREQMVAQLQNEAAKQQATLGQLLASMGEQTEETTRTNDNQNVRSYSTFFFVPNISNKKEVITSESDNKDNTVSNNNENTESDNKDNTVSNNNENTESNNKDNTESNNKENTESNNKENTESDNKENTDTKDTDRENTYTEVIYDELDSKASFTAFQNEEASMDDLSSGGNDSVGDSSSGETFSVDDEVKRRESLSDSFSSMPRTPRSGQKTRRSLNEKPIWRR